MAIGKRDDYREHACTCVVVYLATKKKMFLYNLQLGLRKPSSTKKLSQKICFIFYKVSIITKKNVFLMIQCGVKV